ncbi:MAG TPA: hypothetical protein VK539_00770 [Myxococcaceae bacterium]|nr:hypothetical protein [Myxococcaceae bacterium]
MRAVQTLSLVLWLVGAGCSGAKDSRTLSTDERPRTLIEVRNQRPIDFNVHVLDGTRRIRLGTVPGMTQRTFVIPAHMVIDQGALNFQLDPIGSDQVGTTEEALTVREGDSLSLTIR